MFKFFLGLTVPLVIMALIGVKASAGEADFSMQGIGRAYPQGGSLELSPGYGWLLWGEPMMSENGPSNPWYGYTRLGLDISTAGTYNAGTVKLEFFPVSILGVRGGAEIIDNNKDYVGFDCVTLDCQSPLYREFVEGQVALGAGPVFLVAQARRQHLKPHEGPLQKSFVDISTALKIPREGDEMIVLNGFLGLRLSEKWNLVYYQSYAETQQVRQIQRMHLLNVLWSQGAWSLGFGAGVFRSALKEEEATAVIRLSWTPAPSLSLL